MNVLFLVPKNYEKTGGYYLPLSNYRAFLEKAGHAIFFYELPHHFKIKERRQCIDAIKKAVKEHKIDCFIGFTLNQCFFLAKHLKPNVLGGRRIAFMMDSMRLHYSTIAANKTLSFKIKNLLRLVFYSYRERYCLRVFPDCIFVSNVDAQYVLRTYKKTNRIHYIPNGVLLRDLAPKTIDPTGLRIGMLTSFYPETLANNVWPFLNHVFPSLLKENSGIKLILAGGGASDELAKKLQSLPGIKYLGFVENLETFYGQVDVIITTVQKECGILNRVLEAWSFGKTVVGFKKNFATFTDAEDGVHYLSSDTASDFSRTMKAISQGVIDIQKIGMAARSLVANNYSWRLSGEKLEMVLLEGGKK